MFEKESRNKPGPGAYDQHNNTYKTMPAYKMGTSKRDESHMKHGSPNQAPGAYDPSMDFTKTTSAAFGFGTGKRSTIDHKSADRLPGPGEY